MKKKILIFSLAYYPKFVGGAEIALKEITDRLSPDEFEFHMITNRYDSTLLKLSKEGNVTVHRIGFARPNPKPADLRRLPLRLNKHLFQITAAFAAWRLHRAEHFDCLWAMMAHSCGIPAAIFKMLNPRVRYVLTLQEGDPLEHIEHLARPVWPLFVRGFRKADTVQAISTFLGAWARRMGFKGRLEIIPNGVDIARFSAKHPKAEIDALKAALGKRAGDVFLVTASRLVRKNGIDTVIRALALLPANVRFVVLGGGPEEEALKALARTEGVLERVRFVGGIDQRDLPKHLAACDIFVRPSRSEGMGNAFIEAFAAGLPVIATQVGGIADFLFDHNRNPDRPTTGFAVDPDAPDQIAQTVEAIIAHPKLVQGVVAEASRLASEKYDWDLIAHDMRERVFLPLIASRTS